MGRYYFHVHQGTGLLADEEGREFRDLEQARHAALKGARSLICADVEAGVLDLNGWIEIADEAGSILLVVQFAEAVDIRN